MGEIRSKTCEQEKERRDQLEGRGSLSNDVVRSGKLLPLPMPPLSVEKTVTVSFQSPAALYADVMFSTALSSASTCREFF